MSVGGRLTGSLTCHSLCSLCALSSTTTQGMLTASLSPSVRLSVYARLSPAPIPTAMLLGVGAAWYMQHETIKQIWDANYQLSDALHRAATGRPLVSIPTASMLIRSPRSHTDTP